MVDAIVDDGVDAGVDVDVVLYCIVLRSKCFVFCTGILFCILVLWRNN